MRQCAIGFCLGVLALNCFSHLPNLILTICITLLFSTIGWFFVAGMRAKPVIRDLCRFSTCVKPRFHTGYLKIYYFVLAIFLGFSWNALYAHHILKTELPTAYEGKALLARGFVVAIPETQLHGKRFEFEIKQLLSDGQPVSFSGRTRITWMAPMSELHVGDEWQFTLRLKRPHGTLNPGGFDQEQWLFSHGIRAVGYIVASADNHFLANHVFKFPVEYLRQYLVEKLRYILPTAEYRGIVTALLVGVRDDVTAEQWQVLRATGTNHLIAIAGLHIGLVAGCVFSLISVCWRRVGSLALLMPAPQAGAIAALNIAIFYSALAGFSLPTQRAVIMLAVFLSSILWRRYLPPWNALFLALIIILLLNPASVLSDSFWLSFITVGIIIYGVSARISAENKWWQWGRVQWIITIGLLPLSLLFFQQLSLLGLFANGLAIPWIGFIVLPLILLGGIGLLITPTLGGWLIKSAHQLLLLGWPVLQTLAEQKNWQWHHTLSNYLIIVLLFLACLLILAPKGFPARWLAFLMVLPLLYWHANLFQQGEVVFTLLDVGQGLAAVVRTQHHVLVFDTGDKYGDDFDMGKVVVAPYLLLQQINQLDKVVISHPDHDHSGGLVSLLQQISAKQVISSSDGLAVPISMKCEAGQSWNWDGVNFEFLYPQAGNYQAINDSSCVLRVTTGKNSLLLTGDIEIKSEKYLLQHALLKLPAEVLVAPHHGSKTSSSLAFIKAVHPRYVLFAVGYRNRYHFPRPQILERYKQLGVIPYDTASGGAIELKMNEQRLTMPAAYRVESHHYWNLWK